MQEPQLAILKLSSKSWDFSINPLWFSWFHHHKIRWFSPCFIAFPNGFCPWETFCTNRVAIHQTGTGPIRPAWWTTMRCRKSGDVFLWNIEHDWNISWLVVTGTWPDFFFHILGIFGNNHSNWLSYFSEGFKPPTRNMIETSVFLSMFMHFLCGKNNG